FGSIGDDTMRPSTCYSGVGGPLGFTFKWYSITTTTFCVYSNGILCFSPSTGCGSWTAYGPSSPTETFPSPWAPPHNMVAAYWHDLLCNFGCSVHYQTIGTAPNRIFIMQFDHEKQWFS